LHDGIEMEKRGVPAASIITSAFVQTAKATAKVDGNPSYPFVVVEHPIGRLPQEQLEQRVKDAVPQILKILQGE
jgi:hypothetical protein